jgi:hypothetical protein
MAGSCTCIAFLPIKPAANGTKAGAAGAGVVHFSMQLCFFAAGVLVFQSQWD